MDASSACVITATIVLLGSNGREHVQRAESWRHLPKSPAGHGRYLVGVRSTDEPGAIALTTQSRGTDADCMSTATPFAGSPSTVGAGRRMTRTDPDPS
jgi:alkylation response protein AidB-like acyl-CoA dehydrogenase